MACWRWCCSLHCPFMSFMSQRRYLQTSALLAGDVNLTTAERKHFCQELLNFSGKSGDKCKWWILTVHNLKWEKKYSLHCIVHYQSLWSELVWLPLYRVRIGKKFHNVTILFCLSMFKKLECHQDITEASIIVASFMLEMSPHHAFSIFHSQPSYS